MINRVTLIGRLGSDSDVRESKSPYSILSVATTSGYYDSSKKWIETTQWHHVLANWKFEAKKGDLVIVEGELIYYNGSDGIKKAQVRAKTAKVIQSNTSGAKVSENVNNGEIDLDGDLPF